MNSLKNKTVLITGGNVRVGKVISDVLSIEGYNVIKQSRNQTDDSTWVWNMFEKFKILPNEKITHLVLNASHFSKGLDWKNLNHESRFEEEIKNLENHLRVNVIAQAELVLSLNKINKLESVVFLLDTYLDRPFKNHSSYMISKSAEYGLMRALAAELAPECRVNAVAPGTVLTSERKNEDKAESLSEASNRTLLKGGSPIDVANAVKFLLGSEFITGEVLRVDGGRFKV